VFRIPGAVLGCLVAQEGGVEGASLVLGQNIGGSVPEEANGDEETLLVDANDYGRATNVSASESLDDGANAFFNSLQVKGDTQSEINMDLVQIIFGDAVSEKYLEAIMPSLILCKYKEILSQKLTWILRGLSLVMQCQKSMWKPSRISLPAFLVVLLAPCDWKGGKSGII